MSWVHFLLSFRLSYLILAFLSGSTLSGTSFTPTHTPEGPLAWTPWILGMSHPAPYFTAVPSVCQAHSRLYDLCWLPMHPLHFPEVTELPGFAWP